MSDVNERLPHFREVIANLSNGQRRGHFDELGFPIGTYLASMRPTGLEADGTLAVPPAYHPADSPLVLVTRSTEKGRTIILPDGTAGDYQTLQALGRQAGFGTITPPAGTLRAKTIIGPADSMVLSNIVSLTSQEHALKVRPVLLPRVMILGEANLDTYEKTIITTAHEIDHWHSELHELAAIHKEQAAYPGSPWLKAYLEKLAYDTSYTVQENLGWHNRIQSIEQAAAPYRNLRASQAHPLPYNLFQQFKDNHPATPTYAYTALAVLVAAHLFGSNTQAVTHGELSALHAMHVVDS